MGVKGGVVVSRIGEKGAFSKTRIEAGYVILKVNGKEVLTVDDFRKEIEKVGTGNVKLEGMYQGFEGIFPYPLKLGDVE
jgi:S1-C subfamily serine protease